MTVENYLSLSEKLIIPEYKINQDSSNYEKEARSVLQQIKSFFPQFSLFADKIQESFYEMLIMNNKNEAIQANYISYKSTDFQVLPNDEKETQKFIDNMKKFVKTPQILDILLRINYIYDSFPSLTPNLDDLLLTISMQNENPLIQLALISQLFSMPSRRVQEKIHEFEMIDMNNPGEIVSCIFDPKNQEILPLTLNNPLFQVSKDSIYLRYYKHDYVFSPSTKTVYFCQTNHKNRISVKQFNEFLINDEEKVEEIGIFNDQLCFFQQVESNRKKLRVTIFKKGILVHDIIRKDYIIDLNEEYDKCKMFQNNLMIFMSNGKKLLYSISKHILIKDPNESQFYFDYNRVSVYDKLNEVFILTNRDEDKLIYQIIKHEKKKTNFVQILPPFYGVQTDEIISRVSFELMNLCTNVISDLMESKSSIQTNLVSDPILHIQYALDLSETIQKNDFNHDQNLCDYCLIALTRFIIINVYQLNANHEKLADFQIRRITRLFCSMKINVPHYDTLFGLVSIINYGVYSKSFISNVLQPFISLLDQKRILQTPSFVFFIKPENIVSMNIKEKMMFLQKRIKEFIDVYNEMHLDQELIPFVSTYFETLQEALVVKSISNISISSYLSSIIPFLCIMQNTPQLSCIVLNYFIKNLNKLFSRINPVIDKINNFFDSDDSFNHFLSTQTTDIKFPDGWIDEHFYALNDVDDDEIKIRKKIPNESFDFFKDLTKDDLLIYLLPNALVNCIHNCYDSIEITQAEKDNECYLSYQIKHENAKENETVQANSNSDREEKDFLLQLNEESILIKRLRKETKSIFHKNVAKEIEEAEILIFKALLFQSQMTKYAINVNKNSQINPQIKAAWKIATKVRADLRLAKQFEANKKEVRVNLKERYNDYIISIKEKCAFLLEQSNLNRSQDFNEWIKQNYSFITSNLPLSQLFTLQEIIAKRKEIRNKSVSFIKKIIQMKMPKPFMRSFIAYLSKIEEIKEVLNEDDEFYSFLISSSDPFVRLCTFDFICIDEFKDTALVLKDNEDNIGVLKFLEAINEPKQSNTDIDHLLELIGRCQYDCGNKISVDINSCIRKVSETTKLESLIPKLNGFTDISLGILTIISSYSSIDEKEINLLIPSLIQLRSQLPTEIKDLKTKMFLNLFALSLNLIIKMDYKLCKTKLFPHIDLSIYESIIELRKLVDIPIPYLIELFHEIKEKRQNANEYDENPYFVQLKGNSSSISENNPNLINSFVNDYNFYVFSKPIENNEKIGFHIKRNNGVQISDNSYILLGTIDMNDDFNGIIPICQAITNNCICSTSYDDFYSNDYYDINLMKDPNSDRFSFFFNANNAFVDLSTKSNSKGPLIPFILIFSTTVSITYNYDKNYTSEKYSTRKFEKIYIKNESTFPEMNLNLDEYMTTIPSNITGNKIHIDNAGYGVVIKTNDTNDDAEIALFNDNGIANLAYVNLSSKKVKIIKEPHFLTLLRGITISDGFCDENIVQKYIASSSSIMLSKSLFYYFIFNFSATCISFVFENKLLLRQIIENYKTSFACLVNENIEKIVRMYSKDEYILYDILDYDLVDNPINFLILVYRFDDIFSYIHNHIKYKKVQYNEMDIEVIKSIFDNTCYSLLGCDQLLSNHAFVNMFQDMLNYLLINSLETVNEKFACIDQKLIIKSLCINCNKPTKLPLLIGVIYNHYTSSDSNSFLIEPCDKFVLSMKCKIKDTEKILDINTEYKFDDEIELTPIKPDIPNIFEFINKFNETDHVNTFLKLYENKCHLIRFPISNLSDEKVNSEVLFLYMILFNLLDKCETKDKIFVFKSLQEKLKWLHREMSAPNFDDDFDRSKKFILNRFQKSDQKKLIFNQFYDQVASNLDVLRNLTPFRVNFEGEGGIDQGGLKREAITLIYEELFDTKNEFFEIQDDGFLFPSNKCEKEKLEVVGAFIAACFYSNNPRDFHLSPKIWSYFISSEFSNQETMNEFLQSLKKGFNKIVPEFNLRYFTADDLQKLTCGDSLTFENFIHRCNFYNTGIESVFTNAVSKFSQEELKKLLKFITGSQTLPFDSNFSISIDFASAHCGDQTKWPLPMAHTCFRSVDICQFTDPSILSDKLKLAMLTELISDSGINLDIINFD